MPRTPSSAPGPCPPCHHPSGLIPCCTDRKSPREPAGSAAHGRPPHPWGRSVGSRGARPTPPSEPRARLLGLFRIFFFAASCPAPRLAELSEGNHPTPNRFSSRGVLPPPPISR